MFEGKDKADRVALAVEKQVQHEDDGLAPVKTETDAAHVEEVRQIPQKTA